MKEAYFTNETIVRKAADMRRGVEDRPAQDVRFSPDQSALLVLDVQKYFLDPQSHAHIPSAGAIVDGLVRLIGAYREKDLLVVFTRHINDEDNAGQMKTWWREMIHRDDPLSEIDPRFDSNGCLVIEKAQYDAFHGTSLEETLKERGVKQVVVCGVMTHLCCETTARSAFMRGFEVFFPVDGTATYNEMFHRATLVNLAHGFARLTMVDELIGQLGGDQ